MEDKDSVVVGLAAQGMYQQTTVVVDEHIVLKLERHHGLRRPVDKDERRVLLRTAMLGADKEAARVANVVECCHPVAVVFGSTQLVSETKREVYEDEKGDLWTRGPETRNALCMFPDR